MDPTFLETVVVRWGITNKGWNLEEDRQHGRNHHGAQHELRVGPVEPEHGKDDRNRR